MLLVILSALKKKRSFDFKKLKNEAFTFLWNFKLKLVSVHF